MTPAMPNAPLEAILDVFILTVAMPQWQHLPNTTTPTCRAHHPQQRLPDIEAISYVTFCPLLKKRPLHRITYIS